MKYFDTPRSKHCANGITISRNNEDVGKEYTDEEEVYIQVSAGNRGYAYTAVSRQDARLIAKALNDIADEWDEADRRYAEEHKPNAEKIIREYPVGTMFRHSWTYEGSYYFKVSENQLVYYSELLHEMDNIQTIEQYLKAYRDEIPEMIVR